MSNLTRALRRVLVLIGMSLSVSSPCWADEEVRPVSFEVGVGTHVPLSWSLQGQINIFEQFFVGADVGWVPSLYSSTINGLAQSFGAYNKATEQLINESIANSAILRLNAGWNPFSGFEIFGGYSLLTLGGSVSALDTIEEALGRRFDRAQLQDTRLPLNFGMQAFHIGVGWKFELVEDLLLRLNLSYYQALSASTTIDATPSTEEGREVVARIQDTLNRYLDNLVASYIKLPLVGVSLSYRF